jgi:hypothetical protein
MSSKNFAQDVLDVCNCNLDPSTCRDKIRAMCTAEIGEKPPRPPRVRPSTDTAAGEGADAE